VVDYPFKDFEGSSHRVLLRLVRHYSSGGTLLDLGAAGGHLARALQGHFSRRIGFEYNLEQLPRLSRRLDQGVIIDLETVEKLPSSVDAVILGDVLEHLRDGRRVLRMIRSSLRDDGYLFLSVPNVANIVIRIGLLFGYFTYTRRGILDRTHLRFYTKGSIQREVRQSGFDVVAVHASSIPIRLVLEKKAPELLIRFGEKILTPLTAMMKSLFGYQIVLVARPRR
jgi:SAM-dependent methyltransferase